MAAAPKREEHYLLQFVAEQLVNLSPTVPDGQMGGKLTVRTPDGAHVRDIILSTADLEALSLALETLQAYRECTEEATRPDAALLPEVDAQDVTNTIAGLEQLLAQQDGDA